MMPTSLPVIPPKPTAESYLLPALYLFKQYQDRAAFVKAFGVQPPAFDPKRKVKQWFDTSNGLKAYQVYDPVSQAIIQILLSEADASTVNLPGSIPLEPWFPAPTKSTDMIGQLLNPLQLSTLEQAQELADELQIAPSIEDTLNGAKYDPNDPRKQYTFMPGGQNVGLLLARKNEYGIGHPGKWAASNGDYIWTPDAIPPDVMPVGDPIPAPIRPLDNDERLVIGPLGLSISHPAKSAGSPAGDNAQLNQIATDVAWIRSVLAARGYHQ